MSWSLPADLRVILSPPPLFFSICPSGCLCLGTKAPSQMDYIVVQDLSFSCERIRLAAEALTWPISDFQMALAVFYVRYVWR